MTKRCDWSVARAMLAPLFVVAACHGDAGTTDAASEIADSTGAYWSSPSAPPCPTSPKTTKAPANAEAFYGGQGRT